MKSLAYIALSLLPILGWSQVRLEVTVSANPVGVNDPLQITYKMNTQRGQLAPPANLTTHFHLLAPPSIGTTLQNINGQSTIETEWVYRLKPKAVGTFQIGPARVELNGQVYRSEPTEITVTNESQQSADPNDPNEYVKTLSTVKVTPSKTRVYVGEPLSIQYDLYALTVPEDINFLEQPTWEGFIKENIETSPQTRHDVVEYEGKNRYHWQLQSYVLIPQRPGDFKPNPLVSEIPTPIRINNGGFFSSMRTYTHIHTADMPRIRVSPLPEEGKPEDFTGAVGDLEFHVSLSRDEVNTDESVTLTVEVKGRGNLNTIRLPEVSLPDQLQVFEPENQSDVQASLHGLSGSVKSEYVLIPRYRGDYKIPSLTFSYFDPKQEKYVILTSDELLIKVDGTPSTVSVVEPESGHAQTVPKAQEAQDVEYLEEDIRWIHTQIDNLAPVHSFWTTGWFWTGTGGSLAISMWLLFAGSIRRWNQSRINPLSRAAKTAITTLNKSDDWREMHLALSKFLKDGLGIEYAFQIREHLTKVLEARGYSQETAAQAYELLRQCEEGQYGSSGRNREEVKSNIRDWIQTAKA